MKKRTVAATVLAVGLLVWWAWPRPPVEEVAPSPPTFVRGEAPVREARAVSTALAPEFDSDTDVPEPSPYLAAHAAVAEALGLVAIRCWVGTEYDSDDLVGWYQQRISNGWYTNVVTQLEGRQAVERRFERPDVPEDAARWEKYDFETLFVVSWKAEAPGEVARCEVHPQGYGTLRVRVVDQDGLPLPRASVHCCGAAAESDRHGVAVLEQVRAGRPYVLKGARHEIDHTLREGDWCEGFMAVDPFEPDETRELELALHCLEFEEVVAGDAAMFLELNTASVEEPVEELPRPSTAEELARLRALRASPAMGEAAGRLLDTLIAGRERALVTEESRRRVEEAVDPVERLRLNDELLEHLGGR